jgi:general secretion pathway protein G
LLLLALLALACREDQERLRREEALKQNLAQMRRAIAAYHAEHGRYPAALQDLVPKHLPAVPADPLGGEWRITTEETVQPSSDFQTTTSEAPAPVVIDVHSGAPGTDRNGVPYANY